MTYLVAATHEIRQPGSLIARFLHAGFPVLRDLSADFERQMDGADTLLPSTPGLDYPWSLVGTAIDYRLRFLFDKVSVVSLSAFRSARWSSVTSETSALHERVPFAYGPQGCVSVSMPRVSAELFTALRDFLRRVRPARRYLSHNDEAWLCRYCIGLALIDVKLIRHLHSHFHPLQTLPIGSSLEDLFRLAPRAAVSDVCRLSRRFQEHEGRAWLAQTVTFDPYVGVGNIGASPDVLVGDTLLDLKTTMRPRLDRTWLDQLLLYTLIIGNQKEVRQVGFHLVRQTRTVSWPLEEFVTRASGTTSGDPAGGCNLERLRGEFASVAARSSRLSPKARWGRN